MKLFLTYLVNFHCYVKVNCIKDLYINDACVMSYKC